MTVSMPLSVWIGITVIIHWRQPWPTTATNKFLSMCRGLVEAVLLCVITFITVLMNVHCSDQLSYV